MHVFYGIFLQSEQMQIGLIKKYIFIIMFVCLQELLRLENELTGNVSRWMGTWDALEEPPSAPASPTGPSLAAINTLVSRSQCRELHKRSTVELLVRDLC